MAESEQANDVQERSEDAQSAPGKIRLAEEEPKAAFSSGWRWPIIIIIVGVIAIGAFVTLATSATRPEPPPPPPPPPPAVPPG